VSTVVVLHAFLSYWAGAYARGPVPALAALCGTHPLRAWREADAVLVASDQELDVAGAAGARNAARVRAALPGAEWVGTTERAWHADSARDDDEKLVLVSLSSTWFPGQADAYRRIVAALGRLPIPAVVTTGGAEIETPLDPPANVEVRARAPHAELLPRASLVIGHGGHSTTFRALAHGVPLLVMPMHPLLDQPLVARAVTASGAGVTLPRTAPVADIATAVRTLLDNGGYAAAAACVAQRLRAQDGAAVVADRIETLARVFDAGAEPSGRPGE
jgi:UDP:flavonoid glycosyltransferase YjiC (YdhE family)